MKLHYKFQQPISSLKCRREYVDSREWDVFCDRFTHGTTVFFTFVHVSWYGLGGENSQCFVGKREVWQRINQRLRNLSESVHLARQKNPAVWSSLFHRYIYMFTWVTSYRGIHFMSGLHTSSQRAKTQNEEDLSLKTRVPLPTPWLCRP